MKIIVQTAALQEALTLAGGIVQSRTPKPVLQCVKLIAADNTLTILATDLEAALRFKITAVKIEQEGEALVPAERLNGIVRESSDEDSLTIEIDSEACHVRGAGSYFKILTYDPAEYPAVAEFTDEADFQISSETIGKMIGKSLFATAKAHSHYAISGVLCQASGKKVQLVATDGHRLAMVKGSLSKAVNKDVSAIVPAKLMSLIHRMTGEEKQNVEVKIQSSQILVRTARAVLISSLVQGNFPKYEDVIPKDCDRKATINAAQFAHRIRQAALLTDEESRGVRLSFTDKQVTLSSRAPEAGEAEVTCPITLEGKDVEIAFNPAFLIEALRVVETDDVNVEMSASNKPAMLKEAGGEFLYVIMPVDLK